jgi:uncharacterized protein YjbI with pentapeptide repeats
MITFPDEAMATLNDIMMAETDDFAELARIAGLDPATAYMHSDLSGCDFAGSDLTGFNFTGANLTGCTGLPSPEEAEKIGLILTDADIT